MMRALFVDLDALVAPGSVEVAWRQAVPEVSSLEALDAVIASIAHTFDPEAVAHLDAACRRGGVTHVVFATRWRAAWSTMEMARMLVAAGFRAVRKFSSARAPRDDEPAHAGVGAWLEEWSGAVDSFALVSVDPVDTSDAVAPFACVGWTGTLDGVAARRAVAILTGGLS
jgi:hypothetical protein